MIRVGVVAGNNAIRVGLRELINSQPGLNVASTSINLDGLPMDDLDVLVIVPPANMRQLVNTRAVLILTDDPEDVLDMFRQGFNTWGVLSINSSDTELSIAIQALAEGLLIGAPSLLQRWFPGRASAGLSENETSNPPLTVREAEVLQLAAEGLANKQIAIQLGISEHTIKFHLSSIYAKLGVSSRTEAVRSGVRHGLVIL